LDKKFVHGCVEDLNGKALLSSDDCVDDIEERSEKRPSLANLFASSTHCTAFCETLLLPGLKACKSAQISSMIFGCSLSGKISAGKEISSVQRNPWKFPAP